MGKIALKPRSVDTFGVASVLSDNCKIYYDNLFCSRHIGRVSDLLVAQLKLKGIIKDDLRLRLVLLRSLHEAYRIQGEREFKKGDTLKEPLVIECGVDSEKIAVGVSFLIGPKHPIELEQLRLSVENNSQTSDPLVILLRELFQNSDHLIIRANLALSRVEVVSIMGLAQLDGASAFEAIALDAPAQKSSLSGEYIELGDLDYQNLLKNNETLGVELEAPATGELLAQGSSELSEAVRLKGVAQEEMAKTKISGVTVDLGTDRQVVSGEETLRNTEGTKELELYRKRTQELQNRIQELEHDAAQGVSTVRASAPGIGFKEIIERVWPFKPSTKEVVSTSAQVTTAELPPQKSEVTPEPAIAPGVEKQAEAEKPKDTVVVEDAETDSSVSGQEVRKLVNDEVGFIDSTLKKVEQESQALKKELAPKAQKWVEGMVGDLIGEKARLNDLGKKLSVSIRQKEVEFRNKEIKLQEEIRKRDDSIRQRTHAYNRAREQINQITSQLERAKSGVQTSGEEMQAKQRYAMSQKLLAASKEENQDQAKKIEELREQLATVQSAAKEKKSTGDFLALKAKFDRVVKQAEEFKRANQQLLEKLNELTRPKPAALNPDDLKRRLDVSMKLAASYQKDAEKLKLKVEDHVREESRLKAELARASAALRALPKKLPEKPPGDSGSDQAA